MTYIIALAGAAGAGKDTVADYLVSQYGFVKIAFADALREECAAAFGVGIGQFLDRAKKDEPRYQFALSNCTDADFVKVAITHAIAISRSPNDTSDAAQSIAHTAPRSPRQILQWWGTEYRRAQAYNYWLSKAAEKISAAHRAQSVVVTDCRFKNEADFVTMQPHNTEVWEVQRATAPYSADHASAMRLPGNLIDCIIDNNSTIAALHKRIDDYAATLTPPLPRAKPQSATQAAQAAIRTAQVYQAQDAALHIERMANAGYTYLASPYTAPASLGPKERSALQAHRAVAAAWQAMLLAKDGTVIYSPIAHGHALEQAYNENPTEDAPTITHAQWMAQCYPMLRHASRMAVLMLDGWEASKGVALEIEYCHARGIPVVYSTLGNSSHFLPSPIRAQTTTGAA